MADNYSRKEKAGMTSFYQGTSTRGLPSPQTERGSGKRERREGSSSHVIPGTTREEKGISRKGSGIERKL